MNKSDLDFWKNRVSELEEECVKKQDKIDKLSKDNSNYRNANTYYQKQLEDCERKNKSLCQQRDELQKKIFELESELSAKENLLKIKNGLRGEKSDYGKLMQEILSYEPTNKEDDMALFNYHALRSFYEKQDKEKNKTNRICEYIQ